MRETTVEQLCNECEELTDVSNELCDKSMELFRQSIEQSERIARLLRWSEELEDRVRNAELRLTLLKALTDRRSATFHYFLLPPAQ